MAALKYFYRLFVKRLASQHTNANSCFVVINNEVIILNIKSAVPIKNRLLHSTGYAALQKCLVPLSVNNTVSLFNENPSKLNPKFYLSQIIPI